MSWWVWIPALIAALWAAHWGAGRLGAPLKKLRRQWGVSASAGGAFIRLAAASPEIGINATSAFRGVTDIGLGVMLGANVIAIPFMVITGYVATRKTDLGEDHRNHEAHVEDRQLKVDEQALWVLALPYIGIVALAAMLTLPPGWRGLDPVDGWIMLGAYAAFLLQAVIRGRGQGEAVEWSEKEVLLALGGVTAIAAGTYFAVRATEEITSGIGLSALLGGLFITAPVAAMPEVFATWSVARGGQVTSALTSVLGDHAVTMTVAFLPLALVTVPVEDFRLVGTIWAFAALVAVLYAVFVRWGGAEAGFQRWQVAILGSVLVVYPCVVVFWALDVLGWFGVSRG